MDKWSQIPDELLLLVFCFLKERDLTNASCTCRKWRRVFHDPSLWRSRRFEFSGYYRSQAERLQRMSSYVSTMGDHLHHLHLACSSPNLMTAYSVAQAVRGLLTELTELPRGRNTLQTFTMRHVNFDESWDGFRASKHVLVTSLSHFLQAQEALKSIDLEGAFVTPPFSYRLLRALGRGRSRSTLASLNVINFFCCDTPSRFVGNHMRSLFRRCWQLSEISINYFYLHAVGVEHVCEALADTLRMLRLHIYVLDQTRGEVIPAADWSRTKAVCPRVKVSLHMHCWPSEPSSVLVASLPLIELVVRGRQCWRSPVSLGTKLSRTLDCLASLYTKTLECATFSAVGGAKFCLPSQESLARFLFRCTRLKRLVFSDSLMTPGFMAKVKSDLASSRIVTVIES